MKKDNLFEIEVAPAKPFDQGTPHINGPEIYGASPGRDFLYSMPVRGARPLKFSWFGNIPAGLKLDSETGFITGQATSEGRYQVTLNVENAAGRANKPFEIVIATDQLCLTPLLGWTSWNAFSHVVSEQKVRKTAEKLVDTGLAARGYSYINIDSAWQGQRLKNNQPIPPNENFPDMAGLVSYIHRLGLKAGIYSTPMVHAWGHYPDRIVLPGETGYPLNPEYFQGYFGGCGSEHYEHIDAAQWAEWKFDYVKYDWPVCDPYHTELMAKELRNTGRDFVLSLTTGCDILHIEAYKKYANMCRSNIDTADTWETILANAFPPEHWEKCTGPGTWFDMDMLALGVMTIASGPKPVPAPNRLSRNEMITHMSLWALFPSPLQISCDLEKLDDFTMSLLANEELLDINQDKLGRCAVCVAHNHDDEGNSETRVYKRELADGSYAAAFINLGNEAAEITFERTGRKFEDVRDVWALKDLDSAKDRIALGVPAHGTRVIRFKYK